MLNCKIETFLSKNSKLIIVFIIHITWNFLKKIIKICSKKILFNQISLMLTKALNEFYSYTLIKISRIKYSLNIDVKILNHLFCSTTLSKICWKIKNCIWSKSIPISLSNFQIRTKFEFTNVDVRYHLIFFKNKNVNDCILNLMNQFYFERHDIDFVAIN